MKTVLSREDKEFIWQVVADAVKSYGSHAQLCANRLEFVEDEGRIRFIWPQWMTAIKEHLQLKYGQATADQLLLDVLNEVLMPERYEAHMAEERLKHAFPVSVQAAPLAANK